MEKYLTCLLTLMLFTLRHHDVTGQSWGYIDGINGPDEWTQLGYDECDGRHQSPIDITPTYETRETSRKLLFFGYDDPVTGSIVNDGNSVEIQVRDENEWGIQIGRKKYYLQALHFHFGSHRRQGSEHTINGKSFAMEMHMVHTSADDKQAVVGVFFSEEGSNNTALNSLVRAVGKIKYKNDRSSLDRPIDLESIIPTCNYWRYSGSLTTPPCSEGVTWFLLKSSVRISKAQMESFRIQYATSRDIRRNNRYRMVNNFRPVQSKNQRTIYSFNGSERCGL